MVTSPLAYVLRLIELGHFNYPCSTRVDVQMAMQAVDLALSDPGVTISRCGKSEQPGKS